MSLPSLGSIGDMLSAAGNSIGNDMSGIGQDVQGAINNPTHFLVKNLPNIGSSVGSVAGGIIGGIGGAGTAEVAGLGPEDPVADVAAVPAAGIGAFKGSTIGAGIGGGLGDAAQQFIQKNPFNPGSIITNAVEGAGGNALGYGLGKVGGAVLGKVGGAISDYGNGLASKFLNLTPKMTTDLGGNASSGGVGEPLNQFLSKRGLQGANHSTLEKYTQGIQNQFDQIANNPNIKIQTSDVADGFLNMINQLKNSTVPQIQQKAQALQQAALNFIDKFGAQGTITAPALTAERRSVDNIIKSFPGDFEAQGTANMMRNIYQKAIQEADPSNSLDGLGSELQKLYNLGSKTAGRAGSAPAGQSGFSQGVRALVANGIFGPIGGAASLISDKLLNTPLANSLESGGAKLAGGALQGVGKLGGQIGGALGAGLLPGSTPQGNQQTTQNTQPNIHPGNSSTFPLTQQPPSPINGVDVTQNYNPKTAQWTVPSISSLPAPTDAPKMTPNLYDINQAMIKNPGLSTYFQGAATGAQNTINQYLSQHNLTSDQLQAITDLPRYSNNLNQIANTMTKDPTGWWNAIGGKEGMQKYLDSRFAVAMGMISNEQMQSVQSLGGGGATIYDLKNASQLLPTSTDSQTTAIGKINALQEMLQQQYATYAPIANWYSQVTTQPSGGSATSIGQQPQSTGLPSKPPTLGPTMYPLQ
jgi:hypothetical protein